MVTCHHQNSGQNHNLLTANKSFENVGKLRYLGTTIIYQNCVREEIKSRLNPGNVSHQSPLYIIQDYNFTCCSVWVSNLVSHNKGIAQIEGV
jgi:hypothetical protein